jgi:GxxExxY protein
MLHKELTSEILNAFYSVYNALGYGFLEKVYQNALIIELQDRGFNVVSEIPISVYFKDQVVGNYYADILVENKVILELKAAEKLAITHESQLLNYLKATDMEVGLLLNFGKTPTFKRKIYSN